MSLNGIDISSHQSGIDLTKVPCDFVIVKATQGVSYVNPDFERAYKQAKGAGKCLGVYHYAGGNDAKKEAEHFLKTANTCIGEAVLVLDWESAQNSKFGQNDETWVKEWIDYVYEKTGVKPLLYISQSIMSKFSGIGDYGLWIAQYANMKQTGYQETPWNEGKYSCAIRQYSSCGRLNGYSGNLDLNKFYGDKAAWNKYAGGGNVGNQADDNAKKSNQEKEKDILDVDGKWGTKTTARLQKIFGTTVDGIVSNQYACYKEKNPGLVGGWDWKTKPTGFSPLIKAMQKWAGMSEKEQDGHIGPNTIKAIQKKLGCTQDGYFSEISACVKKLQEWCNKQ